MAQSEWSKIVEVLVCEPCCAGESREPAVHLQLGHCGDIGDSLVLRLYDARLLVTSLIYALTSHGDAHAARIAECLLARHADEDWRLNEGWMRPGTPGPIPDTDSQAEAAHYTHILINHNKFVLQPPHLPAMRGLGLTIRVAVEQKKLLEAEVVGGYRYGSQIYVIYRTRGNATGRFVLRVRHARGVQLWEQDRKYHVEATDLAQFDDLPVGATFKISGVNWIKMSAQELRRLVGRQLFHNRK